MYVLTIEVLLHLYIGVITATCTEAYLCKLITEEEIPLFYKEVSIIEELLCLLNKQY